MHDPEKPGPSTSLLVQEGRAKAEQSAENKPKPDQYVSKSLAAVERAWRESGAQRRVEGKVDGNGTWFSGCFDES